MPDFQRSLSVAVAVFVSVKTVSLKAVYAVAAGACARQLARQAQEAGRRVSRAKKWVELQARRNGRYVNRTRSYMNG